MQLILTPKGNGKIKAELKTDLCPVCGEPATKDGYCDLDYKYLSRGND